MKDLIQGQTLLIDTIAKELVHRDYKRVTELAKEYYDIFTGNDVKGYIKKFRQNGEEDAFEQAVNIYQTTIPASVNNLKKMFEKPFRSRGIFNDVDGAGREEIWDRINKFWQGETESGLDAFLKERWKHLVCYDPNAFIAIEFYDFDAAIEKPYPFAIEYSSSQAIRYNDINGVLDYLIVKLDHKYQALNTKPVAPNLGTATTSFVDGHKYVMYLEDQAIVFTQVDPKSRITDIPNPFFVEVFKNEVNKEPDFVFVRQIFNLNSTVVPAFRVGYEPDDITNGRTTVSCLHNALSFFKKELQAGVELDLTIRAHVFPQKFMYGPKCEGDRAKGIACIDGQSPNGGKCPICKGSKVIPVHTSSTDLVVIPMPKKGEVAMDLTKAVHYVSPPMELVKFMEEYVDRLTAKAKGAIFAAQTVATSQNKQGEGNGTTATEQDYSWDNVYDTYRPYTNKYSYAWLFITKLIAIYTDNFSTSLKLYHKFPADYKLKPLGDLLQEASTASTAQLPQHILSVIHDDIANVLYADDPDTLSKIQIKNKFQPFAGKSQAEIQTLLISGEIIPYYKTLYIYFDIIFDAIDNELGDAFYLMTYQKQLAEIQKRVKELQGEVDAMKQKALEDEQKRLNAGDEDEEQ